ncbi:LPD29 domain-containing protein [Luteococcus sp.]|uniref:LPD29 domain-containing protein n=1 Tax=Luteococcus sp. TaxID=1969402 RepID=UPI0037351E42
MTETLTAPAAESASVKQTAAALRRHLRRTFPGVRFSVTMERGSAHGWISVEWTDGPRWEQVREITQQYESSRFDGMDDAYHATGITQWNCRGVSTQRRMSAPTRERFTAEAWHSTPELFTIGACEDCIGFEDLGDAVHDHFSHTTI